MVNSEDINSKPSKPPSPITGGEVQLIETSSCEALIKRYTSKLNIDVSRFFEGISTIQVYECIDTKYRFFYPFNISGDGKFYEQLQDTRGYYLPWKWEHETALEYIKSDESLLEIGSARGAFLEGLKNRFGVNFNGRGIELNEAAAKMAQEKGLHVDVKFIQEVAEKEPESYDVICFFQVLEHINDVMPFMQSAVKCLKPKGKIILSVPNNASFIRDIPMNHLNMPPHHMGLWDKESLTNVSEILNLKPVDFRFEALSPIHVWSYYHVKMIKLFGNNIFAKLMLVAILPIIWYKKSKGLNPNIEGHTILGVFEKK